MAFWGKKRWLKEGAKKNELKPVLPWQRDRVEAAGYRLSVGNEYFVNGDGTSTVKPLADGNSFVISPGQFAFILTKEKVQVSNSSIGFISMRANLKFRGLVNVSGFQINPGFRGNLVFAVFNAGPRHINIRHGDEIFSVWLADLDAEVETTNEGSGKIPNNLSAIPTDVINGISGDALTAYQLSEKIDELQKQVTSARTLFIRAIQSLAVILAISLFLFRAQIGELLNDPKPTTTVGSQQTADPTPKSAIESQQSADPKKKAAQE